MRAVVLGPGAAGKSTFARTLAEATGVPYFELDNLFWNAQLEPTSPGEWAMVQSSLAQRESWILDGDLGPYDVLDVRLARADVVVLFNPPTWRCVWRTLRRSRERSDYWRWLLTWRRRALPSHLRHIAEYPSVKLWIIRNPRDLAQASRELTHSH